MVETTKTRRRGQELEQAILDAAWDELSEVGYAKFTIEAVAARSETSKPVIYRRWPSRAELVLAAWQRQVPTEHQPIDTGFLRSDLLVLFERVARRVDTMMSEVIAGVMGETFRHPEITAVMRERLAKASPLQDVIQKIVRRAVERGELPPIRLSARVARLPIDLIRNEAMLCGGLITSDVIASLVDDVYLPLLRGLAGR
ncbi:MAG TPA: TetR/AcrR family transcriptional regulator [Amycolatopsis sp.]|uniref:TetR/AcrR family transcriptional regulator n=1 Tax=Amycolatopsis sp. TaxID=37632 RepID=UPI002B45A310|nr:TetR/AcrR family transcriptional regulator [Amycolatopsis sp.]HKS47211.1 TetR/AcrR family transcriptional regulator [Amycolatopsis sp.]